MVMKKRERIQRYIVGSVKPVMPIARFACSSGKIFSRTRCGRRSERPVLNKIKIEGFL